MFAIGDPKVIYFAEKGLEKVILRQRQNASQSATNG